MTNTQLPRTSAVTAAAVITMCLSGPAALAALWALVPTLQIFARTGVAPAGFAITEPLWMLALAVTAGYCAFGLLNGKTAARLGIFLFLGPLALLMFSCVLVQLTGQPYTKSLTADQLPIALNVLIFATAVVPLILLTIARPVASGAPATPSRPGGVSTVSALLFAAAGVTAAATIVTVLQHSIAPIVISTVIEAIPAVACLVAAAIGVLKGSEAARMPAYAAGGYLIFVAVTTVVHFLLTLTRISGTSVGYVATVALVAAAGVIAGLALLRLSKPAIAGWLESRLVGQGTIFAPELCLDAGILLRCAQPSEIVRTRVRRVMRRGTGTSHRAIRKMNHTGWAHSAVRRLTPSIAAPLRPVHR